MSDTYFVDNAIEFRVTSTCSTTGADTIDTIAGGGTIAVGDPLRLNVSGSWNIFRFTTDLGAGEWQLNRSHGISVPSSGVAIKYGIYDGKAQEPSGDAGPFPTIARALAAADGGDAINIKKNSGYTLDDADQIAESLSPTGSGDVANNIKIRISGFNTTPGDMNAGGSYYQSPYEAYLNGIDPDCIVDIDGGGGMYGVTSVVEIDGKDNLEFGNLYFHNAGSALGNHCVYVKSQSNGVVFDHCFFDDAYRAIAGSGNAWAPADGALISNCYIGPTWTKASSAVRVTGVLNFIVRNVGKQCGLQVGGSGGLLGNLMVGGQIALTGNGSVYIKNNTVYNCTVAAVFLDNASATAIVSDNILVPHQDGHAIKIHSGEGGSVRNDYNCIWGADGNQLAIPFKTDKLGGVLPVLGDNSIETDPAFVNAAGGDFRPRKPQVLLGGQKDVVGNPRQMGVVLQQYQFGQRGRMVNLARLGIIRNA